MPNLGSLTIDVAANIARFERALTKAERLAQKRSDAIRRTMTRLGGAVGAALGAFSVARIVDQVVDLGDHLDKLSKRLPITAEAIQELNFVFERSGVSAQTGAMALQRMTRRVAEVAATGKGEAAPALAELGVEAEKLAGLQADKQFEVLAEALSTVQNEADRVRLAFKLFDSEGVAVLQSMTEGAAGIQNLRNRFQELGGGLTQETAGSLAQVKDALNEVWTAMGNAALQAVNYLGPGIISVANAFKTAAVWVAKFIDRLHDTENRQNVQALQEDIEATVQAISRLQNQSQALAKCQGIFCSETLAGKVNDALAEHRERLAELAEQYAKVSKNAGDAGNALNFQFSPGTVTAAEQSRIAAEATREHATALQELQARQMDLQSFREQFLTEDGEEETRYAEQLTRLQEFFNEKLITHEEYFESLEELEAQHQERLAELRQSETELEMRRDDIIVRSKQGMYRSLLGVVKAFAGQSKGAALAILAVEKGLRIAETIASTHAAMMRALAELGPIAGPPVAAAIKAQGVASVAAIAATGLAQAGSIAGGGGAGGGSAGASGFLFEGGGRSIGERTREQGTTVFINLGDRSLFTDNAIREFGERLNEAIEDGMVIRGVVVA